MTNKKIFAFFSKNVDDYDTVADSVVMKNDELHETLVSLIPYSKSKSLKILDLGSGTGHGMSLILKKFPNAKVRGIDFSHKMILKSKDHLESFGKRYELIEANFNEVEFDRPYDAIVSAIAIHNSTHLQKEHLFKKVYDALAPGGYFINGDFIEGETEFLNKYYREIYKNYIEERLSGKELAVWLHHAFSDDMPMKISDQFKLLKKAGFSKIEFKWQFNNEAVYKARK